MKFPPLFFWAIVTLLPPLGADSAPGQPALRDLPETTFSAFRWSGSQTLWFSTFIERRKADKRDLENLRAPEDTFETHLWVNRELFVHSRTPSEPVTVHSNGPLQFFEKPPRSVIRTLEDNTLQIQTDLKPAAEIQLPADTPNWLLIFSETPGQPPPLSIVPIADRQDLHPNGSVQFFNLSSHDPLYVLFGDQVKSLPRGHGTGFNPGSETGTHISIQLADPAVSREAAIYSNMWYHENDRRFLIFITEKSRKRKGLDLKVIRK